MKNIFRISSVLLYLFLFALPAYPHAIDFSTSEMRVKGFAVEWTLNIHLSDFNSKFFQSDAAILKDYLPTRITLQRGTKNCSLEKVNLEKDGARELATLHLHYQCASQASPLLIRYTLFLGREGHQHLLKLHFQDQNFGYRFSAENSEASFALSSPFFSVFRSFLSLGLEHILTGLDHLLFLFSLLLGARRGKSLLALVTTFTLAHSLSLGLAVFNLIALPSRFVESMIAASIVFVALRHFFREGKEKLLLDLIITFLFGLIHGVGFSSALREANFSGEGIVLPLLFFNLGVEAGQIAVVLLFYPLLRSFERLESKGYSLFRKGLLLSIAGVGFYWMVRRIFEI